MINAGINKQKGFTLIELMVVIAIIALLSSVVLASLKGAREKAEGAKIVSELKSLQTALELYRNKYGDYPQVDVDEDENFTFAGFTGFNNFVKTYLFDNKFISRIVQSKNYPNHCIDGLCFNGNFFFYLSSDGFTNSGDPQDYYMCDNTIASNYILGYYSKQKLNLPKFLVYSFGNIYTGFSWSDPTYDSGLYEYCLAM